MRQQGSTAASRERRRGAAQRGSVADGPRRQLQELGLRPYETRVLVALLSAGTANTAELAELSGVPRTSIYQVMRSLTQQGMAEPVPNHGPAVWTSKGWEAVLDALDAAQEERLRQHKARTAELRRALVQARPEDHRG